MYVHIVTERNVNETRKEEIAARTKADIRIAYAVSPFSIVFNRSQSLSIALNRSQSSAVFRDVSLSSVTANASVRAYIFGSVALLRRPRN